MAWRHVLQRVELHPVRCEHPTVLAEVAVELLVTLLVLAAKAVLDAKLVDLEPVVQQLHVAGIVSQNQRREIPPRTFGTRPAQGSPGRPG